MKNKSLILLLVMLLIVTSAIAQQVTEDEGQLAADNNAFAFDLYHAVQEEADNIIFSPYSITQALAMLYLGADGNTAEQMANMLHYTLPDNTLHTTFNATQQRLNNVREVSTS